MKVEGRGDRTAWGRLLCLLLLMLAAAVGSFFLQPLVRGNKDAVNAVITIFSILAGFLIAVITLMVEPVIKTARSWPDLQARKTAVRRKLIRYRVLFYLYLSTLALALATYFVPASFPVLRSCVEYFFVWLTLIVFVISFTLPRSLTELQMSRVNNAINEKAPEKLRKLISPKPKK